MTVRQKPPQQTFGDFQRLWTAKQPQLPGIVPDHPAPARLTRFHYEGSLRIGDRIECNARSGVFRSCSCGSSRFTIEPGAGPHVAKLRCDGCGTGARWLSRCFMETAR
jgi:hypothetical protein